MLLNAGVAALVLYLVLLNSAASENPLLTGVAVGVGLPTLVRTRFTVARQFSGGESGDLSLNLGWLYEQFQALCKTQIDLKLMSIRHRLAGRLIQRYADATALFQLAHHTILTPSGLSAVGSI